MADKDVANRGIYQWHLQKEIQHEGIRQSGSANLLIIITKDSTRSEEAIALSICDASTDPRRCTRWPNTRIINAFDQEIIIMKSQFHVLAAALLATGLSASPTITQAAETATLQLTSDHCTGLCGPQASFGSILLTSPTTGVIDVTVTLNNSNQFVNTGFPLSFAFNLSGDPTITYTSLTSGWIIPGGISPQQTAGSYQMNGFGVFEYGVSWGGGPGGSDPTSGPLSFEITGTGLTLSSFQQSTIPPGSETAFFVADIISGTTGNTGLVDASVGLPPTSVPEPETYAMLLAGLGLMGFVARRRRRTGV